MSELLGFYLITVAAGCVLFLTLRFWKREDDIFKKNTDVEILTAQYKQRLPVQEDYVRLKKQIDEYETKLNAISFRVGMK